MTLLTGFAIEVRHNFGAGMLDAATAAPRFKARFSVAKPSFAMAGLAAVALSLSACAGKPNVDPRLGVAASPVVVENTEDEIPKGGGQQKVGKSYTVAGKTYHPISNPENYSAEGLASWYGSAFHGRMTANGEVFDMGALSAAHPTLPLPSYVRVTNVNNNKSIMVRVNDRGPFHGDRTIDVSQRVAEVLDFKHRGMARVKVDYVGPASLEGSDDRKLMASYRESGSPASATALASLPARPAPAATAPVQQAATLRGTSQPATQQTPQVVAEPTQMAQTTPPVSVASRIDAGFESFGSGAPVIQPGSGKLVQPVLSGFVFEPSAFSGQR